MPSRYLSFRCSVPWLLLLLQALFLSRAFFAFPSADDINFSSSVYPVFQDVNHMVIFGFGFFLMVLRRYGYSSTGFNFLLIVLGVQFSVLVEDLLLLLRIQYSAFGVESLARAVMSMTAVVISAGAVLGKANPVQLIVMSLVELILFHVPENLTLMHVHLFGAYFGLAVTSRFPEPPPGLDKNRSSPKSELFSVLGTVFVWMFWPSFNSILAELQFQAMLSTYLALAVSAVAAFMLSALTSKDGKFRMAHIHSAVLAGGVTMSFTAIIIKHPWIAMILGLLGSVISILGSHCLQRCFNPPLKLQDTSGVHFTFGLPAVLGAVAAVVLRVVEKGIIEQWSDLPSLGYLIFLEVGAFCQTISTAFITGLITGLILNIKLLKAVHVSKYFDDQFYWEFPHLSVGF
ncbi:PREDICTED: blood group Rh(CE) polypeptide isoform X2 [Sturnus vulgaris]|uniref:blood group Rh(CE) polypeptide isoform X2 n=1 Tax=Sturnus vulgaris TaxID=9172 RepID=UPI00071A99CC|nr:PREDICTED: blood group Rh(CE) polypeptide isoform X2 [Sturnus vulgaris]